MTLLTLQGVCEGGRKEALIDPLTDELADRQTDRQTDKQTDKEGHVYGSTGLTCVRPSPWCLFFGWPFCLLCLLVRSFVCARVWLPTLSSGQSVCLSVWQFSPCYL